MHGELDGVLYQQSENGLSTDKDVTMTDGDDEINTEVKDIIDMDRKLKLEWKLKQMLMKAIKIIPWPLNHPCRQDL